ncbi:MAG: precorrin-2 C(20)-methyltransferase [Streptosporangiales bacterium]|nr:precorrin-2 C(20)-methyltransferase [Streptosporangiales bacterium]
MRRRLVGVGVGPGDPELVTVKGARLLRDADAVLVPVLAGDPEPRDAGRAETIVAEYADAVRVRRVVFELGEGRAAAWAAAGAVVADTFARGARTVAFATIGDPAVYSTFTHVARAARERVPELLIETVPGITAMQDLASRSGTTLCVGSETLALLPLTAGLGAFEEALAGFDTVVAYKGGRNMRAVLEAVRAADRLDRAVYGAYLGLSGEDIRPAVQVDPGEAPYLSTLIVPAGADPGTERDR